jgi:hypothetical protein
LEECDEKARQKCRAGDIDKPDNNPKEPVNEEKQAHD